MSDNRLDTARRHSLFLARQLDNGKLKPEIFLPMLDKVLTEADFQAFADWDKIRAEENEEELTRQLRGLRRYVVSQIIVRDINRISDLNEVTRTITLFADFAVNTALDFAYAYYRDMYGTPIGRDTKSPQHLRVVAMGKAGGYEQNVSSDIDLIFIYPESGDTDGRREPRQSGIFHQSRAETDCVAERHYRRRAGVPRRYAAAAGRRFGRAGIERNRAGAIPDYAGARMGTLRVVQRPRAYAVSERHQIAGAPLRVQQISGLRRV